MKQATTTVWIKIWYSFEYKIKIARFTACSDNGSGERRDVTTFADKVWLLTVTVVTGVEVTTGEKVVIGTLTGAKTEVEAKIVTVARAEELTEVKDVARAEDVAEAEDVTRGEDVAEVEDVAWEEDVAEVEDVARVDVARVDVARVDVAEGRTEDVARAVDVAGAVGAGASSGSEQGQCVSDTIFDNPLNLIWHPPVLSATSRNWISFWKIFLYII